MKKFEFFLFNFIRSKQCFVYQINNIEIKGNTIINSMKYLIVKNSKKKNTNQSIKK